MRERDTVWLDLAEKQRPGIVLEIHVELVRVAYGTSQQREWPKVTIRPGSRQGRAFPLREETFFYGANTLWERRANLTAGHAPCAFDVLFAIRKLVEDHDAMSLGSE